MNGATTQSVAIYGRAGELELGQESYRHSGDPYPEPGRLPREAFWGGLDEDGFSIFTQAGGYLTIGQFYDDECKDFTIQSQVNGGRVWFSRPPADAPLAGLARNAGYTVARLPI